MRLLVPLVVLGTGLVAGASCGGSASGAGRERVVVFASASLTEAFEVLAAELERARPELDVELHLAGTPQLVLQLSEGARADVLATADEPSMASVAAMGLCASGPRVLARNHLAILVAAGNPLGIAGLADLARDDLRDDLKVALCGPQVPAGRYARAALARAGVTLASVSDEPSVKAVVAKLLLGELDAGIVYASDARATSGRLEAIALAPEHDVLASYSIAALAPGTTPASGADPSAGASFVAFVLGADGQRILRSFGFEAP